MIDPKHLADRLVGFITWAITSPFASIYAAGIIFLLHGKV